VFGSEEWEGQTNLNLCSFLSEPNSSFGELASFLVQFLPLGL
jgi:hypothetical protein